MWKFTGVTTISEIVHFRSGSSEWCTDWLGKHSMRTRSHQKNASKPTLWYRSLYNQIASDVYETNKPRYKLTTDKLQPMLINVLIRAIFEH